jgi:hypothetical protein
MLRYTHFRSAQMRTQHERGNYSKVYNLVIYAIPITLYILKVEMVNNLESTLIYHQKRGRMQSIYVTILYAVTCIHFSLCMQEIPMNKSQSFNLLTAHDQPSQPLLTLLELLEIKHDGTLQEIVEKTQELWLRKPGTERWHMQDTYPDKRNEILALLDQIGVLKAKIPSKSHYDYILFHGASAGRMQKRFANLCTYDVTTKKIVFFSGERPLDAVADHIDGFFTNSEESPKTEYEIGRVLFDKMAPEKWKGTPIETITEQQACIQYGDEFQVIFIDAPMKGSQRPTTADTVALWLTSHPLPGSCLVISSQPYIGYQHTITRSLMPKEFDVETVGTASSEQNIAVHLDNIARWLYAELHKNRKDV